MSSNGPTRRRREQMINGRRVRISDLIDAGLLQPGDTLFYQQYVGEAAHQAVVTDRGRLRLADGREFSTPSAAATVVAKVSAVAGWAAWRRGANGPTLHQLRQRLLKSVAEEVALDQESAEFIVMWTRGELQVLNVGDGACSVLDFCDDLAVLDCGAWRSGGQPEARLLASSLGRRLSQVGTLIVSHFDADHWRGLQALPQEASPGALPSKVTIHYPGLPPVARKAIAGYLALIALDRKVSVRALDLLAAWSPVAEVSPKPLFEGDVFEVGGKKFNVVWPPRTLPESWSKAATRTLDELQTLADGIPALRRLLDEAYDTAWSSTGQQEALDRSEGTDTGAWAGIDENLDEEERHELPRTIESNIDSENEREPAQADEAPNLDFPDGRAAHGELFQEPRPDIPRLDKLKSLARRLGRLNNHLSLVFSSETRELLALGDVQGWSLRRISERLDTRYAVSLAPHHGTVAMPNGFPRADCCVLQNGPEHHGRAYKHKTTHEGCHPISTEELGHVLLPPLW